MVQMAWPLGLHAETILQELAKRNGKKDVFRVAEEVLFGCDAETRSSNNSQVGYENKQMTFSQLGLGLIPKLFLFIFHRSSPNTFFCHSRTMQTCGC